MIEAIKRALSRTGARPASEDVRATLDEVHYKLQATRESVRELENRRRGLLVTGTDQEIETCDREIETAKRQIETLEARMTALSSRRKEIELLEAVDMMPARVERMTEAYTGYQAAERALSLARAELEKAARDVDHNWGMIEMKRPAELQRMPAVPEGTRRRVHELTGLCKSLPRPEPEGRVPGAKAILMGDREYRLEGRWTQAALNAFSQQQRPRKMAHGETFHLVGGSS